jgi:hypothetical protein
MLPAAPTPPRQASANQAIQRPQRQQLREEELALKSPREVFLLHPRKQQCHQEQPHHRFRHAAWLHGETRAQHAPEQQRSGAGQSIVSQ